MDDRVAPKATVLLVDDELNILKTVSICLEAAGFDVTSLSNPLEGLDAVRNSAFDLAFFDLKMQPIDGMQLLRAEGLDAHARAIGLRLAMAYGLADEEAGETS